MHCYLKTNGMEYQIKSGERQIDRSAVFTKCSKFKLHSLASCINSSSSRFVYLLISLVFYAPNLRMFHFYGGGQQYGGWKPRCAQGKPSTTRRLLKDLPTYSRTVNLHELDLN